MDNKCNAVLLYFFLLFLNNNFYTIKISFNTSLFKNQTDNHLIAVIIWL